MRWSSKLAPRPQFDFSESQRLSPVYITRRHSVPTYRPSTFPNQRRSHVTKVMLIPNQTRSKITYLHLDQSYQVSRLKIARKHSKWSSPLPLNMDKSRVPLLHFPSYSVAQHVSYFKASISILQNRRGFTPCWSQLLTYLYSLPALASFRIFNFQFLFSASFISIRDIPTSLFKVR